jgi:UDP-N-acetylmuramyl tripeptide synthase
LNEASVAPPFEDSRRLTGCNVFLDEPGAVLDVGPLASDAEVIGGWRARIRKARRTLGWPHGPVIERAHAQGTTLMFAAPLDRLYTATEVNEWAVCATLREHGIGFDLEPEDPEFLSEPEEARALAMLAERARAEITPGLLELANEAARHGVMLLADDEAVSLGSGRGVRVWARDALPDAASIDWGARFDAPIALVTGSNGKTTVTRLLAAMARARGWRVAYTCTDGVFADREPIETGDYSGPGGARLALRQAGADAAILETARGGILRRGIAPTQAEVAVVTNISDDHFGEYGIDDLDALAEAKLAVARPLGTRGTLVVNGDDALLLHHAELRQAARALFALEADARVLQAHRDRGGLTCGARAGRLVLERGDKAFDLGAVAAMPLTFGGAARYNIANIAAAVLAADVLGIEADTLRSVLATFGTERGDNPGRLERYTPGGIELYVDYAHNPDSLRGLLDAANRNRNERLGILLGQAGNREEAEIRKLADVVAAARPDHVILKDLPGYQRGRADGEVPAILHDELLARGLAAESIRTELDEWIAVRDLLSWARPGDTLVLPVHGVANRARMAAFLEQLSDGDWRAGEPLPTVKQ